MAEEKVKALLVTEIQALSERERIVLALHYFENLEVEHIAIILHIEEQIIKEILSKIREAFKRLIFENLGQEKIF